MRLGAPVSDRSNTAYLPDRSERGTSVILAGATEIEVHVVPR